MKAMFFVNLCTFGSDLVEYAQGQKLWRSKQEAKRAAAGTVAAILKYELRKQTIFKIIEAWDPISDAVEPNGFPLPMERDVQAYDANGNMVDLECLLNESLSTLIPASWGRKSYTRQEIQLGLDLLVKRYPSDIYVEYTFPQGAFAREFRLR